MLVGCKGREGAEAFFERFQHALARVTGERPATLELAYAVLALGQAESPEAALARRREGGHAGQGRGARRRGMSTKAATKPPGPPKGVDPAVGAGRRAPAFSAM